MIDVGAILQEHIPKGAPVLVLAVGQEGDFFSKDQRGRGVLGVVAVGLAFLWAVDAAQADTFRVLVVQDFKGVAVEDTDYTSGVVVGALVSSLTSLSLVLIGLPSITAIPPPKRGRLGYTGLIQFARPVRGVRCDGMG